MPNKVVLQMGHKDVYLHFFKTIKRNVLALRGGDELRLENNILHNSRSNAVVGKLSVNMQNTLTEWQKRGYEVNSATTRFVVAWKPKDAEKKDPEIAVLLADLELTRRI